MAKGPRGVEVVVCKNVTKSLATIFYSDKNYF